MELKIKKRDLCKESTSVHFLHDEKNSQQPETKVLKMTKTKRKRKNKTFKFFCGCGKGYTSTPALYLHIRLKHQGDMPPGTTHPDFAKRRGRPITRISVSNCESIEQSINYSQAYAINNQIMLEPQIQLVNTQYKETIDYTLSECNVQISNGSKKSTITQLSANISTFITNLLVTVNKVSMERINYFIVSQTPIKYLEITKITINEFDLAPTFLQELEYIFSNPFSAELKTIFFDDWHLRLPFLCGNRHLNFSDIIALFLFDMASHLPPFLFSNLVILLSCVEEIICIERESWTLAGDKLIQQSLTNLALNSKDLLVLFQKYLKRKQILYSENDFFIWSITNNANSLFGFKPFPSIENIQMFGHSLFVLFADWINVHGFFERHAENTEKSQSIVKGQIIMLLI